MVRARPVGSSVVSEGTRSQAPADLMPASSVLAWWGTAWLRGLVGADDVLAAVPGVGVLDLLAEARLCGATSIGLALPVEGDPVGLGGPTDFNAAALTHGQAAVSDTGRGWVPVGQGWERWTTQRRPLTDLGEADRSLRAALLSTANALAALDVARWRPEAADALMNLRHTTPLPFPTGVPARCVDLAQRALQAEGIVELALADDGAAVSASQMMLRQDALAGLDRAARRALVAACSPEVWPPS